jgi:hypothetical protein
METGTRKQAISYRISQEHLDQLKMLRMYKSIIVTEGISELKGYVGKNKIAIGHAIISASRITAHNAYKLSDTVYLSAAQTLELDYICRQTRCTRGEVLRYMITTAMLGQSGV